MRAWGTTSGTDPGDPDGANLVGGCASTGSGGSGGLALLLIVGLDVRRRKTTRSR